MSVFKVADAVVGNEAARVFYPVSLLSDGYVGMAVVGIEDIHEGCILFAFAVYDDAFQVHQPVVHVVVEHHKGEEIVGGAAEVGVENHFHGFFFQGSLSCECV